MKTITFRDHKGDLQELKVPESFAAMGAGYLEVAFYLMKSHPEITGEKRLKLIKDTCRALNIKCPRVAFQEALR